MTAQQIREHIYMYSPEAQYTDVQAARSVGLQTLADLESLHKPALVETSTSVKWLVEYLKKIFAQSAEVQA